MTLAQDLREQRQRLFAAILFVARQEDDVSALAGAGFGGIAHARLGRGGGLRSEEAEQRISMFSGMVG